MCRPIIEQMITGARWFPIVTGRLEGVGELSSSLTFSSQIDEGNGDAHRTDDEQKSEDDDRRHDAAANRSLHFRHDESRVNF